MIQFYVERRVLLLEILRIASTRRVQPSDSILRREAGTFFFFFFFFNLTYSQWTYCYLISKEIVSARRVQPSDSISRRKARNHAILLETRAI